MVAGDRDAGRPLSTARRGTTPPRRPSRPTPRVGGRPPRRRRGRPRRRAARAAPRRTHGRRWRRPQAPAAESPCGFPRLDPVESDAPEAAIAVDQEQRGRGDLRRGCVRSATPFGIASLSTQNRSRLCRATTPPARHAPGRGSRCRPPRSRRSSRAHVSVPMSPRVRTPDRTPPKHVDQVDARRPGARGVREEAPVRREVDATSRGGRSRSGARRARASSGSPGRSGRSRARRSGGAAAGSAAAGGAAAPASRAETAATSFAFMPWVRPGEPFGSAPRMG